MLMLVVSELSPMPAVTAQCPEPLLDDVEEFQDIMGYKHRAQAIRRLLRQGLRAENIRE